MSMNLDTKSNSLNVVEQRLLKYIPAKLRKYVVWLDYESSSHCYFLTCEKDGVEESAETADTVSELCWNAKQLMNRLGI